MNYTCSFLAFLLFFLVIMPISASAAGENPDRVAKLTATALLPRPMGDTSKIDSVAATYYSIIGAKNYSIRMADYSWAIMGLAVSALSLTSTVGLVLAILITICALIAAGVAIDHGLYAFRMNRKRKFIQFAGIGAIFGFFTFFLELVMTGALLFLLSQS